MADLQAIDTLKRRANAARDKKGRLSGQLDSAKSRFREVVEKVQNAGYDPRTLKGTVANKEQELADKIAQFETDLGAVEIQLSAFAEGVEA